MHPKGTINLLKAPYMAKSATQQSKIISDSYLYFLGLFLVSF